jgi:hypothetical protein
MPHGSHPPDAGSTAKRRSSWVVFQGDRSCAIAVLNRAIHEIAASLGDALVRLLFPAPASPQVDLPSRTGAVNQKCHKSAVSASHSESTFCEYLPSAKCPLFDFGSQFLSTIRFCDPVGPPCPYPSLPSRCSRTFAGRCRAPTSPSAGQPRQVPKPSRASHGESRGAQSR